MNEIKRFLIENKYLKKDSDISDNDSLLEKGVIDSVIMLELVAFLENKYSITIDKEDLMPDNFDSIIAIQKYIQSKVNI